ncbi:Symplekin [Fasciola hepatica]|uniref:Symplekin n=1 Tax=Fasciola hepatica TaxID=6192 RepID=A0A4E0RCK6_FASHE|nr:Symplekin [Fasciola hepatica]
MCHCFLILTVQFSSAAGHSTKPYIGLQDILHACRVCFAERRLFTQERLSMAIGQLLEQPVLPTLFMRTVMQALALHPRLAGYVINVLVRLIRKQVWKSKQLWDGFIRCCIKLRPQSYQVLLQLPPERLESVFQREPSMRAQVRRHVENFSSAQRVHISKSIIAVLEHVPTPSPPSTPVLTESVGNETVPGKAQPNGSPASAASSGPGTPTRDEIPAHEVQAAIVAAAAAILQNPTALDATEPHLDDANSCPPESEGSQQDGSSQQHPLSVLVCNRTSGGTASSNGGVFGSRSSRTMDERFQYVPRFRPTSTRTYTRARNRSPHQEPSSPTPEDNPSEAVDKHQRHSPASRGLESVRIEDQTSECHPLESSMEDDDLEPPILPATRLKSAPKRVPVWSRSSSDEVNTSGVSSEFLDTKEEQQKEAGNLTTVALRQPKRPVDLDKLEADRKRLMEESIRFRQQKAEAKQSKSVNPSSQSG